MSDGWIQTTQGRYEKTIGGRTFVLRHNRKTRSWVDRSCPFVCIGAKPRRTMSTTWYTVYERVGDESVQVSTLNDIPGTLKAAKAMAERKATEVAV